MTVAVVMKNSIRASASTLFLSVTSRMRMYSEKRPTFNTRSTRPSRTARSERSMIDFSPFASLSRYQGRIARRSMTLYFENRNLIGFRAPKRRTKYSSVKQITSQPSMRSKTTTCERSSGRVSRVKLMMEMTMSDINTAQRMRVPRAWFG